MRSNPLSALLLLNACLLVYWLMHSGKPVTAGAINPPDSPLFPTQWNHSIPTLHTSFATLLPHLPSIASGSSESHREGSSSTLVVTLATDQFQHLLFNFLCFMHHRLDPRLYPPGSYLVVSSSPKLAKYLSDRGVIVLLLDKQDGLGYSNIHQMDLMLDPSVLGARGEKEVVAWGSLHYQALMLERTLTATTLVSLLSEANAGEQLDFATRRKSMQVGGVLLVDNDAVWYVLRIIRVPFPKHSRLSSPSSMIHHHYAAFEQSPSFVYASDIHPSHMTSWREHQLACACFFYSRTANSVRAATTDLESDGEAAELAALGWRHVSLCHIASTLVSLENALQASKEATMSTLKNAPAPSFQHSSLGPVTYLGKMGALPYVSHAEFTKATNSGNVGDLKALLAKVGLGPGQSTCAEKANRLAETSPAFRTSLHSKWRPIIKSGVLPYAHFPPGRSYFHLGDREPGVEPCVVHANYALGDWKERLLRDYGFWALKHEAGQEPQCDGSVLQRSFDQWQRANLDSADDQVDDE